MKKKILIISLAAFLFTGCFGNNKKVDEKFKSMVDELDTYYLTGNLEITNNENNYSYDISVSYKEDDNFKVDLKNKTNNHEQIILKNEEGVYVLTPSLNKSFKFQSNWPYNNSQIYLLQTLVIDIENDENRKISQIDNMYVVEVKANYANNKKLTKQKIYLDKNGNLKKVEVLNNEDIVKMKLTIDKIDKNATFNDDYFKLETNLKKEEVENTLNQIEDVLYPTYVPENTYLESEDVVELDDGQRVILTFAGDSSFTLIEETVSPSDEIATIYGEPIMLNDVIGALTNNSVSYISNNIEYYAVSDMLDSSELLEVVNSISTVPVGK